MHMFLRSLDDGRLTDGQGRTVNFKDAIIIMTSNAKLQVGKAKLALDLVLREGRTNSVLGELGNYFSPEFMNRFDGIIEFKALSKDNLPSDCRAYALQMLTNVFLATTFIWM